MSGRITREIDQSTPLPSSAVELVLNVRRTAATLDAWLAQVLQPGQLNIEEFNVLRILRGAGPEGHPRPEIERRLVARADRVGVSLFHLRSRGLIEGTATLRITDAGRGVLASVDDELADAIRALCSELPEDRLRAAIDVLEHVRQRIAG